MFFILGSFGINEIGRSFIIIKYQGTEKGFTGYWRYIFYIKICNLSLDIFYMLLFHSLFKVEFGIDHFVLGEHRER